MRRADRWLASDLNKDLNQNVDKQLAAMDECRACFRVNVAPECAIFGAVWMLYEIEDPSQLIKYARPRNETTVADAKAFICEQVDGRLEAEARIECGMAFGRSAATGVNIHMLVFGRSNEP
jgi:hypothetical protein